MKRFICLIIALIAVCNLLFTVNAGVSTGEIDDISYKLLSAIGIFEVNDLKLIHSGNSVTRGEFAEYIVRMLKAENIGFEDADLIIDVPKEHKHYKSIMVGRALGIINKNTQAFEPDRAVTYTEAMTMILRALGYGDICELKSGYPIGYIDAAADIDLINGFESKINQDLKYTDLPQLLYNAVSSPLLKIITVSEKYSEYIKNEDSNILSEVYSIYKTEGIVSANGYTSLSAHDSYNKRYIEVNGSRYLITDASFNEYLGYSVRLFYKDDDQGLPETVYLQACDNDVITVHAEDVAGYKDGRINYFDEGGRKQYIDVNIDTKYIYNDKAIDYINDFSSDLFDVKNGCITAIDNNGDGVYDVVKISEYSKNLVFSTYNDDWELISDVTPSKNNISLKDKRYSIQTEDGRLIDIKSLARGDVLSVYESKDGELIRLVVSYRRITGVIDTLTSQSVDRSAEAVIGNETYKIAENMELDGRIKVGSKGTFYLNMFGEIVHFEETAASEGFFALLQAIQKENDISENVVVKLLRQTDDEGVVFELAPKLIFDGVSVKNSKVYDSLAGSGSFSSAAVYCKVNENNEITYLDTAAESISQAEKGVSLIKIRNKDEAPLKYKLQNKSFGMRYYPSVNGVVQYGVPTDETGAADWESAKPGYFENDTTHRVELYALTDNNDTFIYDMAFAFGISPDEAKMNSQLPLCIVTDIKAVIYMEKNIHELTVSEGNKQVVLRIDEGDESVLDNVEKGDIIRYGVDNRGYVKKIDLHYDYSEDVFPISTDDTASNQDEDRNLFYYGTVWSCEGDYVSLRTEASGSSETQYAFNIKHCILYHVNKRTGDVTVTVPTVDCIRGAESYGTSAQRAIMHSRSGLTYGSVPSVIIDR